MKSSRFGEKLIFFLRALLIGLAFVGFGLGGWLLSLTVLPLAYALGGTPRERRQRCQRLVSISFRFFHFYMRVTRLVNYRPEALSIEPGSVVIANHPTLVDFTAITAAKPEMCCIVKHSIYDSPLFHLLMRTCGHIRIDRADPASAEEAFRLALGRLHEGHSVLIFPEGTRSPMVRIGDFHPGAFALAALAEAPLIPLAIHTSLPLLKRGVPWYRSAPPRARLWIETLPIRVVESKPGGSRRLAREIRSALLVALGTKDEQELS